MGADIHLFTEVRKNGKWQKADIDEAFGWRSYGLFGFFADVRNYSHVPQLADPKGLPNDSEYLNTPLDEPQRYIYGGYDNGTAYTKKGEIECDMNYHSLSWFTLKELMDFDYDQTFEDRRTIKTTVYSNGSKLIDGRAEVEPGQGTKITFREFLGSHYFDQITDLQSLGQPEDIRIIFWFDN
jgi:hypothetical protein